MALVPNSESQEHRRREGVTRGFPPEHPRASSTDDVEGFFSIVHEMLEPSFDLKTFYDQYPKMNLTKGWIYCNTSLLNV